MRQNSSALDKSENGHDPETTVYAAPGNVRNIGFILSTGKRMFLNYAYLVSAEYSPDDGLITLNFTSHCIAIKGANLADLYDALMQQLPRQIDTIDERYISTLDKAVAIVTAIEISSIG